MKDELGERMKNSYENRTRYYLPRRSNIVFRIDGKAFHTYTRGLEKPFDKALIEDMNQTAIALCSEIQGAKFAYVQSDEISVYVSDKDTLETQAWFDNNLQKMVSISSSIATAKFNKERSNRYHLWWNSMNDDDEYDMKERDALYKKYCTLALFDSRAFVIPEAEEVVNYFVWRQQDCTRNSIQSVAQSMYSQKELHGKHSGALQELIFQKGINWNDCDETLKRGRFISKVQKDGRTKWVAGGCPVFSKDRDFLLKLIK